MNALEGKVAVVTGASRGIGRAISLALAEQGAAVVLGARTVAPDPKLPGALEEVKAEIVARGGRAHAQATDVRDESQVAALVESAASRFGGLDILVNNAGALFWAPVEATPAKRFDLVMAVNARAAFLACAHAVPHLRKRGGGVIVNISPPLTAGCAAGRVAYMISKFGVSLLTEGLAAEVGGEGIRVYSLWPVTLVESQATVAHQMGEPRMWRKPAIVADSVLALVTGQAKVENGSSVYDEDVLASCGITDLSKYACVPGEAPPRFRLDDPDSLWRQH